MSVIHCSALEMQKSVSSMSTASDTLLGPALITLASDCAQLMYNDRYWDVAFLCCDGETLHANRAFLAVRSEFFRGLLFGGLHEAGLAQITLGVRASSLRLVLHFLHTLEVKHAGISSVRYSPYGPCLLPGPCSDVSLLKYHTTVPIHAIGALLQCRGRDHDGGL